MVPYLTQGWFSPEMPHRLRDEVLDGVLDSAGMLTRAGVPCAVVQRLAKTLRAAPKGAASASLKSHILDLTDGSIALQAFVIDCLDAACDKRSWEALCLHLDHIAAAMPMLVDVRRVRRDVATEMEPPELRAPSQHLRP